MMWDILRMVHHAHQAAAPAADDAQKKEIDALADTKEDVQPILADDFAIKMQG